MAFASSFLPGEFIIDDSSPDHATAPPPGLGRGLLLGERRTPYGAIPNAERFPSHLMVPRSEWQDRCQEMEERKSRLSDLALKSGLICKNQQQTNFCTTADTEVLTDCGWVSWPDYNGSDLLATVNPLHGKMEFQAPTAVQVFDHDGPMIYSANSAIDFGVTPDHRMLVRKWDERRRTLSSDYTFVRAADVGWYFGLPSAPTGSLGLGLGRIRVVDDREYDGDDFLAMLALIISDGYAGGSVSTRNWVSFACFREDRLPMVRALAARVGFREKESIPGVFVRYDAGALANWLRANAYDHPDLKSYHKCVPGIVKHASEDQIRLFLKWYGDQSHDRGNHYFSTSKRAIDDIQELLLRVGKRGSIWTEERDGKVGILDDGQVITSRRIMHHLHVRSGERLSIHREKHLETEHYRGPVYCATVPNSTLITRRNNSVLISGNCWANAPTHCMEVIRLRQNNKPVSLSPASIAAPIKNYTNQGGWGEEALRFIVENGVCPSDLWPDNAIARQYNTEASKAARAKYRCHEWIEIEPRNLDEYISMLMHSIPVAIGLNWWSHEVTAYEPVWLEGTIAVRCRNSWGMEYGSNGFFILQGQKMMPDDAVAAMTAVGS